MNTIQERILQYLENKGITPYRFCKDLGFSMGYLDKKGAIGTDKYLKIIEYYSDINPQWLLTGEGAMFRASEEIKLLQPEEPASFREQLNDKNLIITLLKEKVEKLEKENHKLKKENEVTENYQNVAEPSEELKKEPKK